MSFDPVVYSALNKKYKNIIGTIRYEHSKKLLLDSVPCDGAIIDTTKYPLLLDKLKNFETSGIYTPLQDNTGTLVNLTGPVNLATELFNNKTIGVSDNVLFSIDHNSLRSFIQTNASPFKILKRTTTTTAKINVIEHIGSGIYLITFTGINTVGLFNSTTLAYSEKGLGAPIITSKSNAMVKSLKGRIITVSSSASTDVVTSYESTLTTGTAITSGLPTEFNVFSLSNFSDTLQLIVFNKINGLIEAYELNTPMTAFTKIASAPVKNANGYTAAAVCWVKINSSVLFMTTNYSIFEFNYVSKKIRVVINNSRRAEMNFLNTRIIGVTNSKIYVASYSPNFNTIEYNNSATRKKNIMSIDYSINGSNLKFSNTLIEAYYEPQSINSMVQFNEGSVVKSLQNGMISINNPRYLRVPSMWIGNSAFEARFIVGPKID